MTAEELFDIISGGNFDENSNFKKSAMIEFAGAYAEQKLDQYKALVLLTKDGTIEELLAKNKELTAALELALEALKDAHVMGDFSDDIEAIKEVLSKEK